MKNDSLMRYIKECEEDYKQFLGISNFPKYELICKQLTLEKSEEQGFDSWATALYDIPTGKHSLEIWAELYTLESTGKYIVFHELTHILDDENIVGKDKFKYVANHGYTEYHASQIELMQLLGAKDICEHISFSVNSILETIGGEKTVKEFVEAPHFLAGELINRADFPANIETMKVTLGLIFNYFGRRSICKMYAKDYQDNEDNSNIAKLIYPETVTFLNGFMIGWFDKRKVTIINELYQRMILSLIKKYNIH